MARLKPSMTDIATALSISKNAVSLALAGKPGVSSSTREAVERAANELGYRRKPKSSTRIRMVALLFNESLLHPPATLFFGPLIQHLQKEMAQYSFGLTVFGVTDADDLSAQVPAWPQEMVKGIITLSRFSPKFVAALQSQAPVVWVDHYDATIDCDKIVTENRLGGFFATEHLIALGHRAIGFLGNVSHSPSYMERWQGFALAVERSHLLRNPLWEHTDADPNQDALADYLNRIPSQPSAWFCANDLLAVTLVQVLKLRGVLVPDQVAVVGFDDLQLAQTAIPPVTTMHVDPAYYATRTVQALTRRLDQPDCPTEMIRITPKLIARASSADVHHLNAPGVSGPY